MKHLARQFIDYGDSAFELAIDRNLRISTDQDLHDFYWTIVSRLKIEHYDDVVFIFNPDSQVRQVLQTMFEIKNSCRRQFFPNKQYLSNYMTTFQVDINVHIKKLMEYFPWLNPYYPSPLYEENQTNRLAVGDKVTIDDRYHELSRDMKYSVGHMATVEHISPLIPNPNYEPDPNIDMSINTMYALKLDNGRYQAWYYRNQLLQQAKEVEIRKKWMTLLALVKALEFVLVDNGLKCIDKLCTLCNSLSNSFLHSFTFDELYKKLTVLDLEGSFKANPPTKFDRNFYQSNRDELQRFANSQKKIIFHIKEDVNNFEFVNKLSM